MSIKTIGVLTSGGDAPGMNAAVRAIVREGIDRGMKVLGIYHGYAGLLNKEIKELTYGSVSEILGRGGTILKTSRCSEMMTEEGQRKAADVCRKFGIEGLIVIGGDGTFRGAQKIQKQGISVIGVPGTIDGDIGCTDYTIGFDTAINAVMEAIDRIKDTSSSHECCTIIEVMGRNCGSIAVWCGMASGAERVLVPEVKNQDLSEIIEDIRYRESRGKREYVIVNAEGTKLTEELTGKIRNETGMHTRTTILGFIQRGGTPTCRERVYATMMGANAVRLLAEGKKNRVVVHKDGGFSDVSIDEVLANKVIFPSDIFTVNQRMSEGRRY